MSPLVVIEKGKRPRMWCLSVDTALARVANSSKLAPLLFDAESPAVETLPILANDAKLLIT
jgi:hypothetical protein